MCCSVEGRGRACPAANLAFRGKKRQRVGKTEHVQSHFSAVRTVVTVKVGFAEGMPTGYCCQTNRVSKDMDIGACLAL